MWPFLDESFLNEYVNECHESEPIRMATYRVRKILDTTYKNAYLNKNINEHCQHLTVTK